MSRVECPSVCFAAASWLVGRILSATFVVFDFVDLSLRYCLDLAAGSIRIDCGMFASRIGLTSQCDKSSLLYSLLLTLFLLRVPDALAPVGALCLATGERIVGVTKSFTD